MKDTTDPIVLASSYRLMATIFRHNAEILHQTLWNDESRPSAYFILPFYFLVSHTAELLLKCALLKRGWSEQDLKSQKYRHDLKSLLRALREIGCMVTATGESVIIALSEQHKKHELRYGALLEGSSIYLPKPEDVFLTLDELLLLGRLSPNN
jgi:hypothetical protein